MGLSVNYSAIKQRIRRLPELVETAAETSRKRDALKMVKYYREGLGQRNFPLPPLARSTVRQKQKMGYAKPENPLYAGGQEITRTLVRNFRVFKTKDGYTVKHPEIKHHKSKLTIAHLAAIHEHGLLINTGRAIVSIPPRPAIAMSFKRVMQEIAANDPAVEVQAAVSQYLAGNGDDRLTAIMQTVREYESRYGNAD